MASRQPCRAGTLPSLRGEGRRVARLKLALAKSAPGRLHVGNGGVDNLAVLASAAVEPPGDLAGVHRRLDNAAAALPPRVTHISTAMATLINLLITLWGKATVPCILLPYLSAAPDGVAGFRYGRTS